jgi:phage-related tail fiber protein
VAQSDRYYGRSIRPVINISVTNYIATKQDTLVSGTNIKTINNESLLGSGNISLATENYVNNAVANLVDSAPGTLDTLNELAAALGDDPNFATTVATQIGNKADKSNMTAGTYRSVTVNNQGIVTAGTNPTTLAGYGITDAINTSSTA